MLAVDCINDLGFIMRIITTIVYYIRIIIPVLLILLIIFDFAKVVTGTADDKAKNEATNKAVKRIIYAVIIFLVPTIISFVFKSIENYSSSDDSTTPTSWIGCWNYYYNNK